MKKVLVIFILIMQFFITTSAETIKDYYKVPYVGKNIEDVINDSIPCVLVIVNPQEKMSIMKYFPIGKMVYNEFQKQYNFCILNANVEENRDYVEFFNPAELPAVYIINPSEMTFARIGKKYHNSRDMKRILTDMSDKNRP